LVLQKSHLLKSNMEEITEKEYLNARKIVDAYEKQQVTKKLSIYVGCTKEDLLITESKNLRGNHVWYFWVTKSKEVPDRNADGTITFEENAEFYTLENSSVPYENYDKAYNNLLKTFKRKGFIK